MSEHHGIDRGGGDIHDHRLDRALVSEAQSGALVDAGPQLCHALSRLGVWAEGLAQGLRDGAVSTSQVIRHLDRVTAWAGPVMLQRWQASSGSPWVRAAAFGPDLAERDLDFLLLEEAAINPEFLVWLFEKTGVSLQDAEPVRLERSVSTYVGESDLVIVVRTAGQRHALLIENKIAAVFQPAQPERYRKRGEAEQQAGHWDRFTTVLIAPAAYLASAAEAARFDARISYEAVVEFYAGRQGPRAEYRARLVGRALTRAKRPWVRTVDPTITAFFQELRAFAQHTVPGLPLPPETGRGPTSTWLSLNVEGFQARVLVEVKTLKGWSDLRLYQVNQVALQTAFQAGLPPGAMIVGASRSAAIRLLGPAINPREPFAPQLDRTLVLLRNAQLLYDYAREHAERINQLL